MIEKAKGKIAQINDGNVRFKCICGYELTIEASINDDSLGNICSNCERRYILQQVNTVWEKLK